MRLGTVALTLSLCAACGVTPPPSSEPEDGFAVSEGKEDDFLSETAYEYVLEGRTSVVLEADLADADAATKDARVRQLIGYKQIAIAWFLTQYLVEKQPDDSNADFGGFGGMAKAGAYDDLDVTAIDDRTYEFTFRQIVAGKRNLVSHLPITSTTNGRGFFDLEIGRPSNEELGQLETNKEWYRKSPWKSWNPSQVPADKKETLSFAIERERSSSDAWFDYESLFADDVLTIDVHFGWDYHDAYHVKHARSLHTWLKRRGFEAPVESFDELARDSGAYTTSIEADGRDVEVRVRVYYGKADSDTDPDTAAGGRQLESDVRASLAESDAIVYTGHSGPFYGFALANWKVTDEGDFDDSEMATATMPERYQIVFAEGCDTYHVGEAFKRNPAKANGGIDVITTTSFSDAGSNGAVTDFISRLIERDSRGRHRPRTVKSLLSDLDGNSFWAHPMYGIHGIDDNPALHPYAEADMMCQACSSNTDCGGPGNMCIRVGDAGRRCAAACTDDRGCPDGYRCAAVASSSSRTIYGRACVPVDNHCE